MAPVGVKTIVGKSPEEHVGLMFEALLNYLASVPSPFTIAGFNAAWEDVRANHGTYTERQGKRMTYGA